MKRLHVQLTPQIHEGRMQFYWHIDLHTQEGQFTIRHGWAETLWEALDDAHDEANEMGVE